jgi:hypothetical protein
MDQGDLVTQQRPYENKSYSRLENFGVVGKCSVVYVRLDSHDAQEVARENERDGESGFIQGSNGSERMRVNCRHE